MFTPKDDRSLEVGMLVGVHWNARLNKYSVIAMKSRKVIGVVVGYVDKISLEDCTFHIDKTKQALVRSKGSKDRHAFVVGIVRDFGIDCYHCTNEILYNPFKYDTFKGKYWNNDKIWTIKTAKNIHMNNKNNLKPVVTFDDIATSWEENK